MRRDHLVPVASYIVSVFLFQFCQNSAEVCGRIHIKIKNGDSGEEPFYSLPVLLRLAAVPDAEFQLAVGHNGNAEILPRMCSNASGTGSVRMPDAKDDDIRIEHIHLTAPPHHSESLPVCRLPENHR